MYMVWRLKLKISPHAMSCDECLGLSERYAPRNVFSHGAFSFTVYQHDIRPMRGNGAKAMHIDVSSAQGILGLADLLSNDHGGRQVIIEYPPKVFLTYTTVKLVQSR